MKKILKILSAVVLSVLILSIPCYAATDEKTEQKVVSSYISQAQDAILKIEEEKKTVSEVIDTVNQSVVAIIGRIQNIEMMIKFIQNILKTFSLVLELL